MIKWIKLLPFSSVNSTLTIELILKIYTMKNINFLLVLALLLLQTSVFAQTQPVDSTGYPGDNFSLQGALEMFKTSASPEDSTAKMPAAAASANVYPRAVGFCCCVSTCKTPPWRPQWWRTTCPGLSTS